VLAQELNLPDAFFLLGTNILLSLQACRHKNLVVIRSNTYNLQKIGRQNR
jgi:hypothetical protein